MKKKENFLEKISEYLKEILNVNKEHKNITEELSKNSIKKKEQRIWNSVTISLMILAIILGGGFLYLLAFGSDVKSILDIEVSPERIMLNEKGNINFEIKFTNIGKINLGGFDIFKIYLYRMEDKKLVYKKQIIVPWDNKDYSISCSGDSFTETGNLPIGESCTIKTNMYACPECFDDKDKEVYLLIYFDSVPPIENQKVEIPIY